MHEHVLVTRHDRVVELRLQRAEKKNALSGAMYDALASTIAAASLDEGTSAVLITADGPTFTAGNDIADFLEMGGDFEDQPAARFVHAIANSRKPLVAAVRGAAVGVGTTMLLHCDLVYAAPDARFTTPFVAMGLVPEAGASMLLPRLLGPQRAARMLYLGEALTADEAFAAGFVSEIVPASDLDGYALAKSAQLAALPPNALTDARVLVRGDRGALLAHMEREMTAFAEAVRGPEARALFAAFVGRRGASA